jgi:prepilin-type N-terminal cleavage/methylation domain-containing protein
LRSASGFTLVEITIVLVIVGALLYAVLRGTGLVGSANVKEVITTSQDMSTAMREFRQRFRMWPGDFGLNAGTPEIPGVSAKCLIGGANAGNNNGIIDATESVCVPEVLSLSGIIGKAPIDAAGNYAIVTAFGNAIVVAAPLSGVTMPVGVQNVLRLTNVPCDAALQIDRTIDDGDLSKGKVAASVATCTPGGTNDPVPIFAIGL